MRARSLIALTLLAFALYAPNLRDYFLGDDFDLIASFSGRSPGYLVSLLWSNESGEAWKDWGIDPELGRGYLRPLKIWLLAADFALWGPRASGFHGTATALFAANLLLLFALLRRALPGRETLALAGSVAAATHPVFSEIVPFLTAREETLSTALGLGSFLAFLRHRQDGRSVLPFLGLFALAMLTKESSLIFLALPLAWDLAHGRLRPGAPLAPLLRTWGPAVLLLAVYLGLRWIAFGNLVGGDGRPTHYLSARALAYHARLFASLADPTLFWPATLSGGAWLAAAVLGLPLLAAAAGWRRASPERRRDLLFYGPLWYAASTALYTGIPFATRHHALPVMGLFAFTTLALGTLLDAGILARERLAAALLAGLGAVLFLPSSVATSLEFHEASTTVSSLRAEIAERTADLPDGCDVFLSGVPQLDLPPFYFGWGLLPALGRPFTESDLSGRCRVFEPRNLRMTRVRVELPDSFDRAIRFESRELVPPWVRARYRQRLVRDLGAAR